MSSSVFSMPDMAPRVSSSRATRFWAFLPVDGLRQQSLHQGKRLQRLAQIMTCRGKKSRFRGIGNIGLPLGFAERVRCRRRSVMSAKVMTTPSTALSWVRYGNMRRMYQAPLRASISRSIGSRFCSTVCASVSKAPSAASEVRSRKRSPDVAGNDVEQ